MDLIQFCRLHGIIIEATPPIGLWKRYPTDDHPRKRNGAVKYMGTHAFVQNHATETIISIWKPESGSDIDIVAIRRTQKNSDADILVKQKEAATRAGVILKMSGYSSHKYLADKGFPNDQGNVWFNDGAQLLVVPMRVNGSLVGCQLIDEQGNKKFLFGQRSSGASFVIDNKGINILCEGFATGLSVQQVMKNLKMRYTIHVCFSAGNMQKIATTLANGIVVADNDASGTGQRVAESIGWPYWLSDQIGEDFNDYHVRVGTFKAGMSIRPLVNSVATLKSFNI
jgi:putative DNA primase/helicase